MGAKKCRTPLRPNYSIFGHPAKPTPLFHSSISRPLFYPFNNFFLLIASMISYGSKGAF